MLLLALGIVFEGPESHNSYLLECSAFVCVARANPSAFGNVAWNEFEWRLETLHVHHRQLHNTAVSNYSLMVLFQHFCRSLVFGRSTVAIVRTKTGEKRPKQNAVNVGNFWKIIRYCCLGVGSHTISHKRCASIEGNANGCWMEWKIRMGWIVPIVYQRITLKCINLWHIDATGERGSASPGNDITTLVERQIVLYRAEREPSAVHISEKVLLLLLLLSPWAQCC